MRRSAFALVAVTCAFAPVSCVEVTTARKGESAADAQGDMQSSAPKSKVRVYAWNPFDGVWDVVSFPFKVVARGVKKIF